MEEARIKVTGDVQGVFYRKYTCQKANQLDLTGYAKNKSDGSVEIIAQGPRAQIQKLAKWCKQGSPSSSVTGVFVTWKTPRIQMRGFVAK